MRSRTSIILSAIAAPVVIAFSAGSYGCGASEQPMHSADRVPASEGTVEATAGENDNTELAVKVQHLAPPAKVEPNASVYVVWIQPPNGQVQNLGALAVDDNLEGRLEAVTPHKQFQVTITPEPNAQATEPSSEPVFTADVVRNE